MSAWIVSKRHIDVLISAGLREGRIEGSPLRWFLGGDPWDGKNYSELTYENTDEVGQMLLDECVKSVSYRYPDDTPEELPGYDDHLKPYKYSPHSAETILTPGLVFKQIDCYEYQSCEHDGWEASAAKRFCDNLRDRYCTMVAGYEDAPWGID